MTTSAEKRAETIRPEARRALLAWYDDNARTLAWRIGPSDRSGSGPDPYRVWLSEVMLQQTTTGHAAPYFERFTTRWPTVTALAAAEDAELMGAWAGLGYYARARNLLACARAVAGEHRGVFPDTEAGLRALPGVGAYTAAAVAAIAFERPANVVDGNVERVMARLFAVETPLPRGKPELTRLAGRMVGEDRPGDWAQALMDLGATVCRPRQPLCGVCPVADWCEGRASGRPEQFPVKAPKVKKPRRRGIAWVMLDREGRVALVQRPNKGLLGGMAGLPTSDWGDAPAETPPTEGDWLEAGSIDHVFTHFALTLEVRAARGIVERGASNQRADVETAIAILPTVFCKALARGLAALDEG